MRQANSRWFWRFSGAASVFTGTVMGYDIAVHRWDWFPVMAACTAVNSGWARYHYRRAHPPEPPHRPDYAKIRRLELELGLRDPDPPPDPEPVVRVTRVDQIRHADPPSFQTGLPPSRFDPRSRGQHYELEVPPAVTSPNEWAYCPVCTRRHAGRCAG